jgi:trimethylamine---corrinoid protein Co-methyltransferase
MIPRYHMLSEAEIKKIHAATVWILGQVGVRVYDERIVSLLEGGGAIVDRNNHTARIPEKLLMDSIASAGKSYILYGRDGTKTARFGYGDLVALQSPGQPAWIDLPKGIRRAATSEDARRAILLGDALPNVDIVGTMCQPVDIPTPIRDIWQTAEMVKGSTKPTRCWMANGDTARYILEIYKTVAGGEDALRQRPMAEPFVEPISPLREMADTSVAILFECTRLGQPFAYGAMVQTGVTGPVTLAGALAQENAENLAAIVVTQLLCPGTPTLYGGIAHTVDMRSGSIVFGSAEQGLISLALIALARWYGFPVYVNTCLTDSNVDDEQTGMEKGINLTLAALAGADLLAHIGIVGTDQGGSLEQLVMDNELLGYVKRIMRGIKIDDETLALDIIQDAARDSSYLGHPHTLAHLREELWIPTIFERRPWEAWKHRGAKTMTERAAERVKHILNTHRPAPIDERLAREIDGIVDSARRHLL